LIQAGRTNLQRFSWADAAERTLCVYERVLGAPARKAVYA
jgi:hypothetical protein